MQLLVKLLLRFMAANLNYRPTLRKILSSDRGWINFTAGIRRLMAISDSPLAFILKTAGYRTAMVGKWHLGDDSIDPAFNPRLNVFDLLTGQETSCPHEALVFYHFDQLEGIRVGRWKYFRRLNRYVWPIPLDAAVVPDKLGNSQLGNRWPLLYDLELDPVESYNVIDTCPDVAAKMENHMRQWEKDVAENPGGRL